MNSLAASIVSFFFFLNKRWRVFLRLLCRAERLRPQIKHGRLTKRTAGAKWGQQRHRRVKQSVNGANDPGLMPLTCSAHPEPATGCVWSREGSAAREVSLHLRVFRMGGADSAVASWIPAFPVATLVVFDSLSVPAHFPKYKNNFSTTPSRQIAPFKISVSLAVEYYRPGWK